MKLELKSIQFSSFASHETHCYEAKLYVNGKPFALISNQGHGGPDHVAPITGPYNAPEFWATIKDINAFLADSDEGKAYTADCIKKYGDKHILTLDLEGWCSDRVSDHLTSKDLKSLLRSKVVYLSGEGTLRQWAWKGVRKVTEKHINACRKDCDGPILNEMPFDEALAIYKGVAA